jgi:hypothetical protein
MRDAARSIDMTENEVTAELFACRERLFEVHLRALLQRSAVRAEGSLADGFSREVGGEAIFIDRDYGETATVHRDAVGYCELGCECGSVNSDAATVILQRERLDRAEMLDDSGEHEY